MQQQIGSIEFELLRKPIKHMRIHVLPPDGLVQVVAPHSFTETAIRLAFIARMPWVKKQQQAFQQQARQSERQWVSGECHYLWGKAYRLEVMEHSGAHQVRRGKDNYLQLWVRPRTSAANKAKVLQGFYRQQLITEVPKLLEKWLPRMELVLNDWRIKQMKTKWGSCNIEARRLWLNLELAKKPYACLEYVLVHELVHLLERKHNDRFMAYMDRFLPDWPERRELLNRLPLDDLKVQDI